MSYNPGNPTPARLVNQHEQIYAVDSFRGEAKSYLVNLKAGTCTCPHFAHRGAECKHLVAVKAQVAGEAPRPPVGTSVKVWGPTTNEEAFAAFV